MDEKYISDEVYDHIFKNNEIITLDFIKEFPNSYTDISRAAIFLCIDEDKPLFKITIERV
jgi:hypothetical protein